MIRAFAALLALAAVLAAAPANADNEDLGRDDTAEAICTADDLGQTPSQIADSIHRGDPRWNTPRAWQKTWWTLIVDGCE